MTMENEEAQREGVAEGHETEADDAHEPGAQVDLEAMADATARKILSSEPMSMDQIRELVKSKKGVEIGVMGWWAKVGASPSKPGKPGKPGKPATPGSRISGQIVSTFITPAGKFKAQQAVIIYGRNQTPSYVNKQGVVVPAVDSVGRWIVGIDSTLTELPARVGDVVDIEFQKKGADGQRHTYAKVDAWSVSAMDASHE